MKTFTLTIAFFIASLITLSNSYASSINDYLVSNQVQVTARLSESQVVKELEKGNTCLKDGVRVLAMSKNLTKKHCQKSKILGLRVIKASQITKELYVKLTGLK